MGVDKISLSEARRIALSAQGFAEPRPSGRVNVRHLCDVIKRLGVLQLDSVNVLCRSHYLPLFSRLGPYPRSTLDRMVWGPESSREIFEYFWGHKAALLPTGAYPAVRWRMRAAQHQVWGDKLSADTQVPSAVAEGMSRLSREQPGLIGTVLGVFTERGPLTAAELDDSSGNRGPAAEGGRMWNWKDTKIAVEALFAAGRLAVSDRRHFERVYDLAERVIPAEVLNTQAPGVEDSQRELVRTAGRASGIATTRELCAPGRSYVALPAGVGKQRVAELVEAGDLIPTRVEGLGGQYYRWREAECPDRVEARALLSPFDSLIWTRDRTERLFGFHYRVSIYTPESERVDGYYVLPFLLGDQIVARVDLRADRKTSTLHVPVVNVESEVPTGPVISGLVQELESMAGWLDLDEIKVGDRGNLADGLVQALQN
ncbi:DNA glycosylase AlkZ-like family protein [Phytoactinopolyspora endophytica]|uniref:winged helix-turn-helix domain-containing protein n=1 Tax=Phytoactinopolyspora endophytica TaxID=1642495 RepID=UPI00101D8A06